ncbi:hypothetical protein LXL04_001427 [Taraxacum kok-saghyz]
MKIWQGCLPRSTSVAPPYNNNGDSHFPQIQIDASGTQMPNEKVSIHVPHMLYETQIPSIPRHTRRPSPNLKTGGEGEEKTEPTAFTLVNEFGDIGCATVVLPLNQESSDGDAVKWCNDLYGGREDKATVGWWRGWKRVEESDIGVGGQIREIFGEISGFESANDPVIRNRDLYNNLNSLYVLKFSQKALFPL